MKLRELLTRLAEHQVRFSVIGGVALISRGVQRATEDLDIAYARDRENLARLAAALAPSMSRGRASSSSRSRVSSSPSAQRVDRRTSSIWVTSGR